MRQPIPATKVVMAFGAMGPEWVKYSFGEPPPMEWCRTEEGRHWEKMVSKVFFYGGDKLELIPREGVDPQAAWDHLMCLLRSWEPKHEHKTATVAKLAHEWFSEWRWKD